MDNEMDAKEELAWLAAMGLSVANPPLGLTLLGLGAFAKWAAKPTGKALKVTVMGSLKGSWWITKKIFETAKIEPKAAPLLTLEELVEAEKRKLAKRINVVQGLPLNADDKTEVITTLQKEFLLKVEELLR